MPASLPRAVRLATAMFAVPVVLVPRFASGQGSAHHGAGRPAAAFDSVRAVATFDSALAMLRTSHDDRGVHRVDWDAVRRDLRVGAERARSDQELRNVLRAMIARVGESHVELVEGDAGARTGGAERDDPDATPGDAGFDVRLVEGRLTVVGLTAGGAAQQAGIDRGWWLDAIDDDTFDAPIERLERLPEGSARRIAEVNVVGSAIHALRGSAGSTVRVRLIDPHGDTIRRDLVRQPTAGIAIRYGNLPTLVADLTHARLPVDRGCVGVVRMSLWMAPLMARFDHAMDSVRTCDGIVLDLRGNVGGVAAMVMGVAGYFVDDARPLGTLRNRGTELRFIANPRRVNDAGEAREPFAGPLAILVDQMSVSTSEIFAVAMQTTGRARLFGEPTSGQALPAVITRLPNGDALMHVIADFTAPDGTRIEGRGAIPDEAVPASRQSVSDGRDVALEAAVRWIARGRDHAARQP